MPRCGTIEVAIRPLRMLDVEAAAGVCARGMRDNPNHIRAYGSNPVYRLHCLELNFLSSIAGAVREGSYLGAFHGQQLVGVCGMNPPGTCRQTMRDRLRFWRRLFLKYPVPVALRVIRWFDIWRSYDPPQPHWHLGPVAVDAILQGGGIGSALLTEFCRRMDEQHALSYLETDKPENVRFYEHYGFRTVAEAKVIGTRNWFMLRDAR